MKSENTLVCLMLFFVLVFSFVVIPLASAERMIWSKQQLTNNGLYDGYASISNDGFRIAFSRSDMAFNDIWRIFHDGTGAQQLVFGHTPYYCSGGPSISGDGSKIFFAQDTFLVAPFVYAPLIHWVSWDGTCEYTISQPTPMPPPPNWRGNRDPSPDDSGNSVVYQSWDGNDWEIYLTDSWGYLQITNNPVGDWSPSISSGGTRVVWQQSDSTNNDWDIYGAESPNWTPTPLSEGPGGTGNNNIDDTFPSISGDGTKVAWQGRDRTGGDWDIWGVAWGATIGTPMRKAGTSANGDDKHPCINHGGGQITYQSNEGSPSYDIWNVNWDGTVRERLTGPDTISDEHPTKRGDHRLGGCTIAYQRRDPSPLYWDIWALKGMFVAPGGYHNRITQAVDVSKIRFLHNAVNEQWVKSSKWPEYAKMLMYWQKDTKYLINLELNETGYVQNVNFSRYGNKTITEIPYDLAEQSLASLPPGFAIGP